jgi:hypothetical protein
VTIPKREHFFSLCRNVEKCLFEFRLADNLSHLENICRYQCCFGQTPQISSATIRVQWLSLPQWGAVTATVRIQTNICGTRQYSCMLFGAQKGNFTWGKHLSAALNQLICWFFIGRRTLAPYVLISDSRTTGYHCKIKVKLSLCLTN